MDDIVDSFIIEDELPEPEGVVLLQLREPVVMVIPIDRPTVCPILISTALFDPHRLQPSRACRPLAGSVCEPSGP